MNSFKANASAVEVRVGIAEAMVDVGLGSDEINCFVLIPIAFKISLILGVVDEKLASTLVF